MNLAANSCDTSFSSYPIVINQTPTMSPLRPLPPQYITPLSTERPLSTTPTDENLFAIPTPPAKEQSRKRKNTSSDKDKSISYEGTFFVEGLYMYPINLLPTDVMKKLEKDFDCFISPLSHVNLSLVDSSTVEKGTVLTGISRQQRNTCFCLITKTETSNQIKFLGELSKKSVLHKKKQRGFKIHKYIVLNQNIPISISSTPGHHQARSSDTSKPSNSRPPFKNKSQIGPPVSISLSLPPSTFAPLTPLPPPLSPKVTLLSTPITPFSISVLENQSEIGNATSDNFVIPDLPLVPDLPSFEYSFPSDNTLATLPPLMSSLPPATPSISISQSPFTFFSPTASGQSSGQQAEDTSLPFNPLSETLDFF